MAPPIDLLQCSASELSAYLYEHRFQKDGLATTTFLLEGTTTLPNAEDIAAQIQGEHAAESRNDNNDPDTKPAVAFVANQNEESACSSPNLGKAHHSQPLELSLINPRGKFNVTLHEYGILCSTVKNPQHLILPSGCVQSVIVFPKPTDCQTKTKKAAAAPPSPMMLLCFDDKKQLPSFKGKPVNQICFPVPASLEHLQQDDTTTGNVVDAWIGLLCRSLGMNPKTSVFRIHNPADSSSNNYSTTHWKFKSHQEAGLSTTSDGMPFVKCYHGVQDGCLYPMKEGLLFFKPPLFIPRSHLHSIACGRGSGASSRYVDMNIVTDDEVTLEFTNINREEIGVLNDYIHKVLIPAMEQDGQNNNDDDNDDDDDDDDKDSVAEAEAAMVVEAGESNEDDVVDVKVASAQDDEESDGSDRIEVVKVKAGRGCRSKRRAAWEAIQTTKQHYLQRQAKATGTNDEEEEDDEEDSEDDAPYQFKPEPASDSEGDDASVEEEEEEAAEGGDDDDGEEGGDGEEDDETEDDEDEPAKKKRRGKR